MSQGKGVPLDPTEVVSLYKSTGSLLEVAAELHTSRRRIAQILDAMGVDRRIRQSTGRDTSAPTLKDRTVEAYKRLGTIQKTAAELHIAYSRVSEMLKDAGLLERKSKTADRSKQSYDDIDRDLHLAPGVKVATPKGIRTIFKVCPYHVATKTRYGNIECFTKGALLSCATAKAEGKDYRDKEDEE